VVKVDIGIAVEAVGVVGIVAGEVVVAERVEQ
jgi:hypothetical protein